MVDMALTANEKLAAGFGGVAALVGLAWLFRSKPAAAGGASAAIDQTPYEEGPPASPPPTLPAKIVPVNTDAKTAALYVGSESSIGARPTIMPTQIAVISRRVATNDGFLVNFINRNYKMFPDETIYAYVTDEKGAVLHTLVFNAGTQPQNVPDQPYVVVAYTLKAGKSFYETYADAMADPNVKVFPPMLNGSSDGSVQRAAAQGVLATDATGTFAYSAVYDKDGTLAIDPATGSDFVVVRV
jgi:hypothetical protein